MITDSNTLATLRRVAEKVEVLTGERGRGDQAAVLAGHIARIVDQAVTAALEDAGIFDGTGTPEGNVAAKVGAIYRRRDGGPTTTLYVKTSGGAGATGWTAK